MIGYRKIGTDSVIGFFARNGNGRDIFALATETRCGAIRNFHSFNNLQDRVSKFRGDNLSQVMPARG